VSVIAVAADRDPPAEPAEPASGAHGAMLERAFGLIYAVFMALMMAVFWSSSATLAGNRPGGVASDVLLSALLAGQTLRALRRLPSQRDLWLMVAATGALLPASRSPIRSRGAAGCSRGRSRSSPASCCRSCSST
jgi:hypothetical protein